MAKTELVKESFKLTPTSVISLFTLDTTEIENNLLPANSQILHFHNFKEEGTSRNIFFGDPLIEYKAIPIEFRGNEIKGDGSQLPRPKVIIGNPNGIVSYYLSQTDGLYKAKLTRTRVFAKFLSGETWGEGAENPLGYHDPEQSTASDVYYVNKIASENKEYVEIELSSILDLEGVVLPRRRMLALTCAAEYRNSTGCGFNDIATDTKVSANIPVAGLDNVYFGASPSAEFEGMNLTLVDRGEWQSGATYTAGDFITIYSKYKTDNPDLIGHEYKKYLYVCVQNHVSNPNLYPPLARGVWKKDACSQTINGCLCRFKKEKLRINAFPALIRVEMDNI